MKVTSIHNATEVEALVRTHQGAIRGYLVFLGCPSDLVDDYYTWMAHHVKPRDEIMLMEIGWPSTGPGSEAEQVDFIRRLPALLRGTRVTTVAWSLLHDVKIPQFGADLGTTGLVTRDGRRKPAWDAFRTLR